MGPMLLPRRLNAMTLMGVLLAACAGPDPSPSLEVGPTATPSQMSPSREPSPSAFPSVSVAPTAPSLDPPPLAIEVVVEGLAAPIGLATGPDGWILVQEQSGRVVAVEAATGESSVALDITDRVRGGGEQGLLGLALHPDFPDDPRAFVHYTDLNGDTVLSEFQASDVGNPIVIDAGTEVMLLGVDQPFPNHNGGQLAFGPDGYLWFGLGDGGSAGDPLDNAQNQFVLLGKILRLDVSEPGRYGIPADNPFADGADGAPEIYHWGLRNPWRFSFDRDSSELFIADVGQNAYEEVNRTGPGNEGGRNFEWSVLEGIHCFSDPACKPVGVGPWVEYGRDLGCSVTGGYVYRGAGVRELAGWYLFADYCSGLLLGANLGVVVDATVMGPEVLLETGANVSSFGEDSDGELYLADHASGTIYRIVAGS
jgi:glucose/arabinose dehydrogenase